jgi:predicted RNase H-like HicB family nuclease
LVKSKYIGELIIRDDDMSKLSLPVVIEQDEDGIFVASVPALPGCHTQAKTLDKLMDRIKEAIELYLEANGKEIKNVKRLRFMGLQHVEVDV